MKSAELQEKGKMACSIERLISIDTSRMMAVFISRPVEMDEDDLLVSFHYLPSFVLRRG